MVIIAKSMTVRLDGETLTIERLVGVARDNENVEVTEKSWKRIEECRSMLQNKIDDHEIMYGITTGIGEFSEVILNEIPSILVYKSSHNEEGSRFWKKSNQNQIWMCDPEALSLKYNSELFIWASLSQIKSLALMDNILNPYVKTIIAPL